MTKTAPHCRAMGLAAALLFALVTGCGAGDDPADAVTALDAPGVPDAAADAPHPPSSDVQADAPEEHPTDDGAHPPIDSGHEGLDVAPDAGPDTPFVPGPDTETIPIYDESAVLEFRVTFAAGELQHMLDLGVAGSKDYVHCGFSWKGDSFPDAACRRKGNPTDFADEPKPQFSVRFNKWDKDGRFHGLRRIKLEAFPGECVPIRDRLSFWMLREAGIDAPRANHARVFVNDAYFGLYESLEAVDREFLEDHYKDPTGNLYEHGNELSTNEATADTADLKALQTLVDDEPMQANHGFFFKKLAKLMDIAEVVREMAGETVFPTFDNYANGAANYYYYNEPGRGFVVIPWDFDQVLTDFTPATSDPWAFWGPPQAPSEPNRLWQLLQQDPGWHQAFEDALVEIRDGAFAKLPARVDYVCKQIHDAWLEEPKNANKWCKPEEYDAKCADLKKRIAERTTFLKTALGH